MSGQWCTSNFGNSKKRAIVRDTDLRKSGVFRTSEIQLAIHEFKRVFRPHLGLPGNPVAVMVTFMRFARPAILLLMGATDIAPNVFRVRAAFGYTKKRTRREWLRATLFTDSDGVLAARRFPREGAGILTSMVESDGLIELSEELTQLDPGTMVDFLPFSEVQS